MLVWNIRHSLTLLTCRLDEVEPAHGMEQPVDVLSNEAPLTSLVPHMHSRPKIGVARQKSIDFGVGGASPTIFYGGQWETQPSAVGNADIHSHIISRPERSG